MLAECKPVMDAVYECLRRGGVWTVLELTAETGRSEDRTRKCLNDLIKSGKAVRGLICGTKSHGFRAAGK